MKKKILLVGEPLILFAAETIGDFENVETFRLYLAGAEVNVSIGLSRLGIESSYFTKLGSDSFGKFVLKNLEKEKIDTSLIRFDPSMPTGVMFKNKVEEGDPKTLYYRKGSAASCISKEDIDNINFKEFSNLHVTGILPALSENTKEATFYLMKKAKENNIFITFDPNLRIPLWESKDQMIETINDIAKISDIILPGIKEGAILTGSENLEDIGKFYLNLGIKVVIIKNGSKGAYVATKEESFFVPGFKVDRDKIVDTVGAGDGFAAGVISGDMEGLSLKESVIRANAIGANVIMYPGDSEGLPTKEGLNNYLSKNRI